MKKSIKVNLAASAAILVIAAAVASILALFPSHSRASSSQTSRTVPPAIWLPTLVPIQTPMAAPRCASTSFATVAERALAGVVNISTTKETRFGNVWPKTQPFTDPFFEHFFFHGLKDPRIPHTQQTRSLGSGVIVSPDGTILTNHHVVDHATTIRVTTADKREFSAKVVGRDPKSDLAVIRLTGKVSSLHPLPFGDSDKLRLGDVVLAVGNPFGVGQTVTMGIVSAKGRANVGIVDYEDFIQTDAAINPGNSGGALVNLRGQLVGINTAILSRSGGNQGVGFAIPINMARPILNTLLKQGHVSRGRLGVLIQNLTPALRKALRLGDTKGVLVSSVISKSPAAKAGLKRGDVIVAIAGKRVFSASRLRNLVATHPPGTRIKLTLRRNGKNLYQTVLLDALKSSGPWRPGRPATQNQELSVSPLTQAARRRYHLSSRVHSGVLVTRVAPGSAPFEAGLQPGDVIVELNRRPVNSVQAFYRRYRASKGTVLLLVHRRGGTMFLAFSK